MANGYVVMVLGFLVLCWFAVSTMAAENSRNVREIDNVAYNGGNNDDDGKETAENVEDFNDVVNKKTNKSTDSSGLETDIDDPQDIFHPLGELRSMAGGPGVQQRSSMPTYTQDVVQPLRRRKRMKRRTNDRKEMERSRGLAPEERHNPQVDSYGPSVSSAALSESWKYLSARPVLDDTESGTQDLSESQARAGHRPIRLVGGASGMGGDKDPRDNHRGPGSLPSGRSSTLVTRWGRRHKRSQESTGDFSMMNYENQHDDVDDNDGDDNEDLGASEQLRISGDDVSPQKTAIKELKKDVERVLGDTRVPSDSDIWVDKNLEFLDTMTVKPSQALYTKYGVNGENGKNGEDNDVEDIFKDDKVDEKLSQSHRQLEKLANMKRGIKGENVPDLELDEGNEGRDTLSDMKARHPPTQAQRYLAKELLAIAKGQEKRKNKGKDVPKASLENESKKEGNRIKETTGTEAPSSVDDWLEKEIRLIEEQNKTIKRKAHMLDRQLKEVRQGKQRLPDVPCTVEQKDVVRRSARGGGGGDNKRCLERYRSLRRHGDNIELHDKTYRSHRHVPVRRRRRQHKKKRGRGKTRQEGPLPSQRVHADVKFHKSVSDALTQLEKDLNELREQLEGSNARSEGKMGTKEENITFIRRHRPGGRDYLEEEDEEEGEGEEVDDGDWNEPVEGPYNVATGQADDDEEDEDDEADEEDEDIDYDERMQNNEKESPEQTPYRKRQRVRTTQQYVERLGRHRRFATTDTSAPDIDFNKLPLGLKSEQRRQQDQYSISDKVYKDHTSRIEKQSRNMDSPGSNEQTENNKSHSNTFSHSKAKPHGKFAAPSNNHQEPSKTLLGEELRTWGKGDNPTNYSDNQKPGVVSSKQETVPKQIHSQIRVLRLPTFQRLHTGHPLPFPRECRLRMRRIERRLDELIQLVQLQHGHTEPRDELLDGGLRGRGSRFGPGIPQKIHPFRSKTRYRGKPTPLGRQTNRLYRILQKLKKSQSSQHHNHQAMYPSARHIVQSAVLDTHRVAVGPRDNIPYGEGPVYLNTYDKVMVGNIRRLLRNTASRGAQNHLPQKREADVVSKELQPGRKRDPDPVTEEERNLKEELDRLLTSLPPSPSERAGENRLKLQRSLDEERTDVGQTILNIDAEDDAPFLDTEDAGDLFAQRHRVRRRGETTSRISNLNKGEKSRSLREVSTGAEDLLRPTQKHTPSTWKKLEIDDSEHAHPSLGTKQAFVSHTRKERPEDRSKTKREADDENQDDKNMYKTKGLAIGMTDKEYEQQLKSLLDMERNVKMIEDANKILDTAPYQRHEPADYEYPEIAPQSPLDLDLDNRLDNPIPNTSGRRSGGRRSKNSTNSFDLWPPPRLSPNTRAGSRDEDGDLDLDTKLWLAGGADVGEGIGNGDKEESFPLLRRRRRDTSGKKDINQYDYFEESDDNDGGKGDDDTKNVFDRYLNEEDDNSAEDNNTNGDDEKDKENDVEVEEDGRAVNSDDDVFTFLEKEEKKTKKEENYSWGDWSVCSVTCGIGQRFRSNLCGSEGTPCSGGAASSEVEACSDKEEC